MDNSKKRLAIKSEFQKIGIDSNIMMTEDQFNSAMDTLAGKKFERFVGDQIFTKADTDYDKKVTVDEFADTFIQAEAQLLRKIDAYENKIAECSEKRQKIQRQVYEYQQMNDEAPRHKLIVFKVKDISGVPSKFNTNFDFQANRTTSGIINIQEFKEDFVMELDEDDREITVYVNPRADGTSHDSKLVVPLSLIADGERIEKYFNLPDIISDDPAGAVICLQFQLVYSQLEYFQKLLDSYDEKIEQYSEFVDDYRKTIKTLYEPFPSLGHMIPRAVMRNSSINPYPGRSSQGIDTMGLEAPYQTSPYQSKSIGMGGPMSSYNGRSSMGPPGELMKPELAPNPYAGTENKSAVNPRELSPFGISSYGRRHWPDYVHYLFYAMLALLVLGLFICFWRSVFLTLIASTLYCSWYFLKEVFTNTISFVFYSILLLLSLIFDIVWLSYYTTGIWGGDYVDSGSQSGLRKFVVVLSYLIMIPKIAAIFFGFAMGFNSDEVYLRPRRHIPRD